MELSAAAPPRFQLSGPHFSSSLSPWLGAGIYTFQPPHHIVLQVFKPKLKGPKKNCYFREVSVLNRSTNNEEKLILGDKKLLWYKWKESNSASVVLLGVEEGRENVDASLGNEMKWTRKLHVSESSGHTALSRDTNHTSLYNRIKHCPLNKQLFKLLLWQFKLKHRILHRSSWENPHTIHSTDSAQWGTKLLKTLRDEGEIQYCLRFLQLGIECI